MQWLLASFRCPLPAPSASVRAKARELSRPLETPAWAGIVKVPSKLEEITDTESREALLDAVAHGSTVAWRHLNLLGEYDFSAEKLRDSVGIRLPKLGG